MTRAAAGFSLAVATAVLAVGHPVQAAPAQAAQAAASSADLAALKQAVDAMRADYEARIGQLETRLKAAEDQVAAAQGQGALAVPTASAGGGAAAEGEVVIPDDAAAQPAPEPVVQTSSPNAMNPGVSVVLNGNYVATAHDTAGARVSGYPLGDDAHKLGRGLSLDESEVTLAANVDPFLLANLTFSFGADNDVSVEEAYVQSTSLPAGLTLRAGRFFSAIGYLNERHAHNWSFIDMPLPYRALLGNQYGDDGVQLRWLAPTKLFVEVGGELYRGDHFPAAADGGRNKPGAQTAFVHTGADINDSSSWLAALSYIHTDAHNRDTNGDIFDGDGHLGIASVVYKWAPGGNPIKRNLVLSGEYFLGHQDGIFDGLPLKRDQNGWYAQGVYQFTERWSAGLRYSEVDRVGVPLGLAGTAVDGFGRKPHEFSGLLEFDTSEFGRFRAQYTRDLADIRPNNEFLFQYTVVYGPHGAHRY